LIDRLTAEQSSSLQREQLAILYSTGCGAFYYANAPGRYRCATNGAYSSRRGDGRGAYRRRQCCTGRRGQDLQYLTCSPALFIVLIGPPTPVYKTCTFSST